MQEESAGVSQELRSMLVSQEEMCEASTMPGITAIIVTSQSHPKLFALSLLSLLCRSPKLENGLEHVIISINGPDPRTGSTEYQDIKQRFVEDLRSLEFTKTLAQYGETRKSRFRDMPITLTRTWSRVGHGECVDGAVPWVHTKNYVLMHDDVFVIDPTWETQVHESLDKPYTGFVMERPLEAGRGEHKFLYYGRDSTGEKQGIIVPHPNTSFLAVRKSRFIDCKWTGCHAESNFHFNRKIFEEYGERFSVLPGVNADKDPDYISHDVGCHVMYKMREKGLTVEYLTPGTSYHIAAGSWMDINKSKSATIRSMIEGIEKDLRAFPNRRDWFNLYYDYFGDDTVFRYEGSGGIKISADGAEI